jgi:hypothetical protein
MDKDGIQQKVLLKPLKVAYLKSLFKVVGKFKDLKKTEGMTDEEFSGKVLDVLDEETVTILSELCLSTVKLSIEGVSDEDAEAFTSSHFMELFPFIIELNMSSGRK